MRQVPMMGLKSFLGVLLILWSRLELHRECIQTTFSQGQAGARLPVKRFIAQPACREGRVRSAGELLAPQYPAFLSSCPWAPLWGYLDVFCTVKGSGLERLILRFLSSLSLDSHLKCACERQVTSSNGHLQSPKIPCFLFGHTS